jgi:hypothetical protein
VQSAVAVKVCVEQRSIVAEDGESVMDARIPLSKHGAVVQEMLIREAHITNAVNTAILVLALIFSVSFGCYYTLKYLICNIIKKWVVYK